MKKIMLIALSVWLMAGIALAAGFRVEVKGSYFSSENSIFRDVYGSAAKFGLEAGLDIVKNVSIFAGVDYLHKSGGLTITEEETRVWITPITVGFRYEIPAGKKLLFHLAAGVQEAFFKEDSILATVKENALGLLLKGGGVYRFNDTLGAGFFLDCHADPLRADEEDAWRCFAH